MTERLYYKDYFTDVHFDAESKTLYGKIEGIADLINFYTTDATKVEEEFRSAVDDYIEFCKEKGVNPDKPYSGVFNVRVSPELHRCLALKARQENCSLNAVVRTTLEQGLIANVRKIEC